MTDFSKIYTFFKPNTDVWFIFLCIAVPIFFFMQWIFRKIIFGAAKQKIATWAATIVSSFLIYFGLIYAFLFFISRETSSDFDKSKWLVGDKESRFEMVDDIVDRKILIGKDTNQVKELLGKATSQDSSNQRWTYFVGTGGGGFGFLFHELFINFDKNKVISVAHSRIED